MKDFRFTAARALTMHGYRAAGRFRALSEFYQYRVCFKLADLIRYGRDR